MPFGFNEGTACTQQLDVCLRAATAWGKTFWPTNCHANGLMKDVNHQMQAAQLRLVWRKMKLSSIRVTVTLTLGPKPLHILLARFRACTLACGSELSFIQNSANLFCSVSTCWAIPQNAWNLSWRHAWISASQAPWRVHCSCCTSISVLWQPSGIAAMLHCWTHNCFGKHCHQMP